MGISFVNKGTFAGANGAVTPGLPSGLQAGDLCLLFIESANETSSVATAGSITWTQLPSSPVGTGTAAAALATRMTIFYGWYTSGTTAPTTNDSGDHNCAIIMAFRGVDSATPFDATPTTAVDASATTSLNANPSITTATANALIIAAIAIDADAASTNAIGGTPANSNLTDITVQHEETISSSDGGGIGIITGFKSTTGASGSITGATTASCTHAYITIALRPMTDVFNGNFLIFFA